MRGLYQISSFWTRFRSIPGCRHKWNDVLVFFQVRLGPFFVFPPWPVAAVTIDCSYWLGPHRDPLEILFSRRVEPLPSRGRGAPSEAICLPSACYCSGGAATHSAATVITHHPWSVCQCECVSSVWARQLSEPADSEGGGPRVSPRNFSVRGYFATLFDVEGGQSRSVEESPFPAAWIHVLPILQI